MADTEMTQQPSPFHYIQYIIEETRGMKERLTERYLSWKWMERARKWSRSRQQCLRGSFHKLAHIGGRHWGLKQLALFGL